MSVLGLNGKLTSNLPCRAYIASTPDQAIIFLQLDTAGQCRTGKIMHYNPSTGKRIKDETIPMQKELNEKYKSFK